jgi:hypothetical protein
MAICAVLVISARGQTADGPKSADNSKEPDWARKAKAKGLSAEDLQLLRENRFVITGKALKQVFEPYLDTAAPVFVTSDSILNGFHVLFEESICWLEKAHARRLPPILKGIWENLDKASNDLRGDPKLLRAAQRRATIFLGTARCLLDPTALPKDGDLRALIEEEIQRVTEAKRVFKPSWLGPPDDGFRAVDYSRFLPRGFYSTTKPLERYFRAVNWLQAIPFRLDNDEELVAIRLLNGALARADDLRDDKMESYWKAFRAFLGTGDDWDLIAARSPLYDITKKKIEEAREEYRKGLRWESGPQINDQLRFAPLTHDGKTEIVFRFLSAYRIPDAVLFQRTMNRELARRDFPTGLEVAAALGSPFAKDKLAKQWPMVLKRIDESRPLFEPTSIYAKYLACLQALLETTEPDAPAFIRGNAWKAKTCQTALASWAQMRHTWVLQAKLNVEWLNGASCPAGLVEPVPEFFSRLADLVERCRETMEEAGALTDLDRLDEWNGHIDNALDLIEMLRNKKKSFETLSPEDTALMGRFDPSIRQGEKLPEAEEDRQAYLSSWADLLKQNRRRLRNLTPGYLLFTDLHVEDLNLGPKWTRLATLCRRIESLAHKQLRQVPFNREENEFLEHYGKSLARTMFHDGNSYLHPRDNAPRVVDVFTNSSVHTHLLVGTDRPRTIWVLYPTKDGDVLCRGAVLPYHEFTHGERLTDEAWRAMLDSPQRPETPSWMKALNSPGG